MFSRLHLLPDWVLQQACWLSLPRQPEIWGGSFHPARDLVVELANTLIDFEPVVLLCDPGQPTVLRHYLDSRITLLENSNDEPWLRDSSPVYAEYSTGLLRGRLVAIEFAANRLARSRLVSSLASVMQMPLKRVALSMLDGDFSVDGTGAMLLSGESLLESSRIQPDKERFELLLEQQFGINRPIWLSKMLAHDKRKRLTSLVRFIQPSVMLLASHTNRKDANRAVTRHAHDVLTARHLTDGSGKAYSVHQVQNPPPLRANGRWLCSSYLNYYIANGVVCIPAFYKPRYDKQALELFRSLFPGYAVRQFQVLPLLANGGGLHCMTRGWPVTRSQHFRLLDKAERMQEAAKQQQ